MQLHVVRAERNFGARNVTRDKLIERRLRSFRPELQYPVRRLARRHSRLADLSVSFPALLVALAVPRAHFDPEPVIARVINGVPLAELAQSARVALWLRRFEPPMLPLSLPQLPDSHDFRRRIVNHLPPTAKLAQQWLEAVANAATWCDEAFAIWVARTIAQEKRLPHYGLPLMYLWAWFSARPDSLAHRFIERPWSPSLQWETAHHLAHVWRAAVALYIELGEGTIDDTWTQARTVDGYEFVPLRSFADILEEGRAMQNCVTTYGWELTHNLSRLWSVRKDGQRVATLQIGRGGDPLIDVRQLKSAGNEIVSKEVAWAVRRWLHMHDLGIDTKSVGWDEAPLNRAIWNTMWKPYWLAKRQIPEWLPLTPSRSALEAL